MRPVVLVPRPKDCGPPVIHAANPGLNALEAALANDVKLMALNANTESL